MKKVITTLVLFSLIAICTASDKAAKVAPKGAWLQNGVKWKNAPAEVNPHLQTAEAALLFFGPDHTFAIITCVVNRVQKQYMTISHGDGQVVYVGKWEAAGDQISTTYRLMSRTVQLKGEKLPGNEQHATIKSSQTFLIFEGRSYRRAGPLDESAAEIVNAVHQQSRS